MRDDDYLQKAMELGQHSPDTAACGILIVRDNEVLAATYNLQHADEVQAYPAEIKAIVEVNKRHSSDVLDDAAAYCSCAPCDVCYAALTEAKVPRIIGATAEG